MHRLLAPALSPAPSASEPAPCGLGHASLYATALLRSLASVDVLALVDVAAGVAAAASMPTPDYYLVSPALAEVARASLPPHERAVFEALVDSGALVEHERAPMVLPAWRHTARTGSGESDEAALDLAMLIAPRAARHHLPAMLPEIMGLDAFPGAVVAMTLHPAAPPAPGASALSLSEDAVRAYLTAVLDRERAAFTVERLASGHIAVTVASRLAAPTYLSTAPARA